MTLSQMFLSAPHFLLIHDLGLATKAESRGYKKQIAKNRWKQFLQFDSNSAGSYSALEEALDFVAALAAFPSPRSAAQRLHFVDVGHS
jgi:hypothetical protein